MKALLTHPGTQYAHRLACQLHRRELLFKFVTGIGFSPADPLLRLVPKRLKQKLSNRILDCSIPPSLISRIPMPELVSLNELRRGVKAEDSLFRRNRSFQEKIARELLVSSNVTIGFDTSSWILAKRAKDLSRPFILDQSIAHPGEKKTIFSKLRSEYPDWTEDIPLKTEEHIETESIEHQLSSCIVVASTFTRNSLVKNGVDVSKILLNPYGVAPSFFRPKKKKQRGEKIRFIYLGILGARKGLPFLLRAWRNQKMEAHSELWVAGPASPWAISQVNDTPGVEYKGRLPLSEVSSLLDQCDCLVFPSFFEGFGQVILEAMAAGLPVISTTATAAPDIIENNVDGMLIEPGDERALVNALKRVATDVDECHAMGERAREKAKSFSWDAYGDRWKNILKDFK